MNVDQIKNEYSKKIRLFKKYNKYYYDKSNPVASDQEYDVLKKEILLLERNHKFLKSNSFPIIEPSGISLPNEKYMLNGDSIELL